ncbi:MAG: FAD-binding oxidoreductase [Deltaproteobacteria bacterium]|nr:FAD-binding oxidoreductase [Deltaproteobacteria bacterium]
MAGNAIRNDHSEVAELLASIVGAPNVSRTPRDLMAAGLPLGPGEVSDARAWLVRPGSAAEIAELVRLCGARGLTVTPIGTVSRKRSGTKTSQARVIIDLKRMTHVLHLDETSLVVHAQAGLVGLRLEELLLPRGLTIGDYPPAVLRSSLGGLVSVRTPGKSSPRHGFLADAVLGVTAVLPSGRTIHTRVAPRRASGPNLASALIGSEGTLGIVTAVVLRIHRRSEARLLAAFRFPSIDSAVASVTLALRADVRPSAVRVYDGAEGRVHLGSDASNAEEAIVTLCTSGPSELATVERDIYADLARGLGGTPLGSAPAEIWWRRRSGHTLPGPVPPPPALEIAAPPSRLVPVYQAVVNAARHAQRDARAHISRFDDDGACIFVTLLDGDRPDPAGPARSDVERAVRDAGGFLVGERDQELAPYFMALRKELDPSAILNPEVLDSSR